jgi:hypothetical protein
MEGKNGGNVVDLWFRMHFICQAGFFSSVSNVTFFSTLSINLLYSCTFIWSTVVLVLRDHRKPLTPSCAVGTGALNLRSKYRSDCRMQKQSLNALRILHFLTTYWSMENWMKHMRTWRYAAMLMSLKSMLGMCHGIQPNLFVIFYMHDWIWFVLQILQALLGVNSIPPHAKANGNFEHRKTPTLQFCHQQSPLLLVSRLFPICWAPMTLLALKSFFLGCRWWECKWVWAGS